MKLPGNRILLVGDQGFGDCIQFSRYIRYVAELCQQTVVSCAPEIAPILRNIEGVGVCISDKTQIPPHAVHCRLSSLPFAFATEVHTIPQPGPYIFADPEKVSRWREKLNQQVGTTGQKKVGLAWRGSPKHLNDKRRSLRLAQLAPLARAQDQGVSFVSLQTPVSENDRAAWEAFRGMPDFSDQLTDFAETAALMANLDLVITVDTAVAHLAGAMGKPTWMLVSKASDWRWFLTRTDSPWYPTMRLFRQNVAGQWTPPIQAVADALLAENQ
jgi:ADP-heptose:LPS heptosyltransferase